MRGRVALGGLDRRRWFPWEFQETMGTLEHGYKVPKDSPVSQGFLVPPCEKTLKLVYKGEIQVATGSTVAVPLSRSSSLTRPPILSSEFVPSCRTRPYAFTVTILGCHWQSLFPEVPI